MRIRTIILPAMIVLLASEYGVAQESPLSRGQRLFGEQQYEAAVAAFSDAVRQDGTNGQAWFWLGIGRYWTGSYQDAAKALKKADELGANVPFARFALARAYARLSDRAAAVEWLNKAADAGFSNVQQLESDSSLVALLADDGLLQIKERIDRKSNPAEYDPRYRQLDFWIGEWDVFNPSGTKVGTNTITKELGGAMLLERWTNAFGNQGASINFFDPGTGKFRQQWVAQAGYNTSYEGEVVNGAMVMEGINAARNGTVTRNRMTFTPNPDGSVTQFIETFVDSTGVWTPSFRGTYKRRTDQ